MQKIKNVLVILALLCFCWIGFFTFKGIQAFEPEQLENHLPQDTYFAVKINNKNLLSPILSDIIFKQKLKRKDLIKLDKTEKGNVENYLQYLLPKDELIIFQEKWNNRHITGTLFKPRNLEEIKNIKDFPYYISLKNELACVVFADTNDINYTLEFRQHIDNLLEQEIIKSPARNKFLQAKNESDQIQVYVSGDLESNVQESISKVNIVGDKITLKGWGIKNPVKLDEDQTFHYLVYDSTKVNALTGELPDTLNYYFKGCLQMLGLPISNIVSNQLQYKGVKLITEHTQLKLLPQFNAVFRYEDSLTLDQFKTKGIYADESGRIEFPPLKILGEYFYVLHVGAKELYVGMNENPAILKQNTPREFEFRGDVREILTVDTDPFMLGILGNFPLYANSKAFLNAIHKAEIKAECGEENTLEINGEIRFKNEEEASVQLVKYLLSFVQ